MRNLYEYQNFHTDKYDQCREFRRPYSPEIVSIIRYLYVLGLILWFVIIWYFELYITDTIGYIILLLPIIIFLVGIINTNSVTPEVEDEIFQANYLSIGLLILLPLLTWANKAYGGDKKRFTSILVLAIILSMLSMLDFWVSSKWLSVMKHLKSILQTMSLVLLIYALYDYYLMHPEVVMTTNDG